jgi:Tol biopolymer transport system component
MSVRLAALFIILVSAFVASPAAQSGPAETMLEAARKLEVVDGDVRKAAAAYQAVVERFPDRSAIAAEALLRLGGAHEKLGEVAQARAAYERLVRAHGEQTEQVSAARGRLAALTTAAPGATRLICADCANLRFAELSLDGRRMTLRSPGADGGVAVRDMETGAVTRVASGGWGALSRDGRRLAFSDRGTLKVVGMSAGSEAQLLVNNPEHAYINPTAWFPGDRSILVEIGRTDETWQVGVVSADTGAVRVLTSLDWRHEGPHDRPALSPDGEHVVYSALAANPASRPGGGIRRNSNQKQIFLLSVNGQRQETTLTGVGKHSRPVWTPDGRHVVFVTDSDLWSVAVRDGRPDGPLTLVKAGVGQVDPIGVTPSGTLYFHLYKEVAHQIEVKPLDQPRGADWRNTGTNLFGRTPVWAPDGRALAYSRLDTEQMTADVVTHSIDTGQERVYAAPGARLTSPMWTPDASALLADDRRRVVLRTGEVMADTPLAVPDGFNVNFKCGLSPDGRQLFAAIFRVKGDETHFAIASFDATSGELRTMLPIDGLITYDRAALSPDGRTLAVEHSVDGALRLSLVGVDGSAPRTLVRPFTNVRGRVTWARDSRSLLYVADGHVMRVSTDGGAPQNTGRYVGGADAPGVLTVALNADGTRAAMWRYIGGVNELWALDVPLATR